MLFIYREDQYDRKPENENTAEIIIGKQRNGPTGRIRLSWESSSTRFRNYADMGSMQGMGASSSPWADPGPSRVDPGPPAAAVGDGGWDDLPT